jgi:hypothetical protein
MLRDPHRRAIGEIVRGRAARAGVKVYGFANSGNHLHIVIRARTRESFQSYARVIAGLIARRVTGARKGKPSGRFWDALLFTRVMEWGRAFRVALGYLRQNRLEAWGVVEYRERKRGRGPPG